MRIYGIVFYDSDILEPLDHKIYTNGSNRFEKRFIGEFVNFGRKELISKLKTDEKEHVISLGGDYFYIFITIVENIGLAILMSDDNSNNISKTANVIHLLSRKMIVNYISNDIIPDSEKKVLTIIRNMKKDEKTRKVLSELEGTKKVMIRTISKVMKRGDKIEELVDKTNELSTQSKIFFKTSRKMNRCCFWF